MSMHNKTVQFRHHTAPYLIQSDIHRLTAIISSTNLTFYQLIHQVIIYCCNTNNPLHTLFISVLYLCSIYGFRSSKQLQSISKSSTLQQQRISTLYITLNYTAILQCIVSQATKHSSNTHNNINMAMPQLSQTLNNTNTVQSTDWLTHPFITILLLHYISIQQYNTNNINPLIEYNTDISVIYTYIIMQQPINCSTSIQSYKSTTIQYNHNKIHTLNNSIQHTIAQYNKSYDANNATVQQIVCPDTQSVNGDGDSSVPQSWEHHSDDNTGSPHNKLDNHESKMESNDDYRPINELNELLDKAYKQILSTNEKSRLIELFQTCCICGIPDTMNLSINQLSQLIDKNSSIVSDLLLQLYKIDPKLFDTYANQLIHIDVSLHSMEVVNRLTSILTLSSEFLQQYINTCLSTCSQINDKYLQTRLVRLVCVFITSLLRNNIVDSTVLGTGLLIELQSFALDYSKVKEATALYKLCKNIE